MLQLAPSNESKEWRAEDALDDGWVVVTPKEKKRKEKTKTSGHIELSDSSGDEDEAEETRRARALEVIES